MKKEEFITWMNKQKLNLNGNEFFLEEGLLSKKNYSSVLFKCECKNNIWYLNKIGPDDRTSGSLEEILKEKSEESFFEQVKNYLEDEDYVNNCLSKPSVFGR